MTRGPGALSGHETRSTLLRCYQITKECLHKVEHGTAHTQYEHRGQGVEDQGHPPEIWECPGVSGRQPYTEAPWTLHVDCSGFIRRVYQTATGAEIMASLRPR